MKHILSLILLSGTVSFAFDLQSTTTNTDSEIIDQNYVQIDISNPKLKNKSLVKWKYLIRAQEKKVESYNRIHHFGRWINDKHDNGCYDTRAKVLIRDSVLPIVFKSGDHCSVESGQWLDPYTKSILTDAILDVQIDHLVPLKNAYISGAHAWNYKKRCFYANYLGANYHLKPIDGNENAKKGDDSPADYIPSNKKYRCTYIKNWLKVKSLWNLEMTLTEANAIKKIIYEENCNTSTLTISEAEIKLYNLFFKNNQNLCPDSAPALD